MMKASDIENNVDQLRQNYLEMNEVGKEKLKKISKKILEIYTTVNEVKTDFSDNVEKKDT